MFRAFLVAAGLISAALLSASPATAAPCDDTSGMSSIEYALDQIGPDSFPAFSPGSSCSSNDECESGEKCEGGSCCVKSGESCSGLGYCCGHPSQGCVNGTCP